MGNFMQGLIDVIYMSHQYNCWDYISMGVTFVATITSLVFSVLALRQSGEIGERQNKIALFEMRYQVFSVLNFLLTVVKITISQANKSRSLDSAMKTYLATTLQDKNIRQENFTVFYTGMILECVKIDCLFANEDTRGIREFLQVFQEYMENIADSCEYQENEKRLQTILANIENERIMERLEQYLKL